MAITFDEVFENQYTAGTGRKRSTGFIGGVLGRAQSAPKRREAEVESELYRERINSVAEEFDKQRALQEEANAEAKKQAETANVVNAAGVLGTGATLASSEGFRRGLGAVTGKVGSWFGVGEGSANLTPVDLYDLPAATGAAVPEMATGAADVAASITGPTADVGAGVTSGTGFLSGMALPALATIPGVFGGKAAGRAIGEALGVGGRREREAVGGILGGAATGAAVGAIGGPFAPITVPIGAAIGAGVGALTSLVESISDWF